MSAGDLAAVIVTVVCLAVAVTLVVAVTSLVRTLRELRATVEELRGQTLPMVGDLRTSVVRAGEELERVDVLLDRAERISGTVDSASRLTYRAVGPAVVKVMAAAAGVGRAVGRLGRRRDRSTVIVARGRERPIEGGARGTMASVDGEI